MRFLVTVFELGRMKFPQIYAWMNKCIWTEASIIYTDQVSPSKTDMNTNCFDGSSVRGIWLWNTASPLPEYVLSAATLASGGENKKAIIPRWGCWCCLSGRWQREGKNELPVKVENETMQRSCCVSEPGTNLSLELKIIAFAMWYSFVFVACLGAILNTPVLPYLRFMIRKLERWEANLRLHNPIDERGGTRIQTSPLWVFPQDLISNIHKARYSWRCRALGYHRVI